MAKNANMKPLPIQKFDNISERARERIYALVMKHYQKHPDSPWSGKYLVELEKTIKAFYREMGVEYQGAFRDTLPEKMQEFYDAAVKEIRTAGTYKAVLGEPDAKRVKYFLDSSFQQVAMKTDKMSFDHIRELRKISAEVFRDMSLTGNTRKEISKALLDKAMKIPGFEFIDKSGSKWAAKSYFKMLARTEIMNAARASYDEKMADEGFDVMKLTTSGDSCEHCAKWEGRLFSLSGATPGLPTKADLEADGVFHPNCTHSYSLVPDYIRETEYTPDGKPKQAENIRSFARKFKSKPEDEVKKFDGVFNSEDAKVFDKKLRESKLDNAQIDEFNANMKRSGHLLSSVPNFEVIESGSAHTDMVTGKIFVQRGSGLHDGCRNTISHEFGELLFNNYTGKNGVEALHKAILTDRKTYPAIIKNAKNISENDILSLQDKQSRAIFGKSFDDLDINQKHRITSFFDVAGSATGGEFGFGHYNYLDEIASGRFGNDAFADVYVAVLNGYEEYKAAYPALWNLVEGII